MEVKNNLMEIRLIEYDESPKEFAHRIGVQYMTYYRLEAGKSTPSLTKALNIAKKLNKQLEEIWYLD